MIGGKNNFMGKFSTGLPENRAAQSLFESP
jgi:hypothetical protein